PSGTTTRTAVVALGDEGSVPRQQRVRRDDRGELAHQASSQRPRLRGEPTALVVGETQAPGAELFAQDTVLFQEIVDDVALLLVEPAGERDQDELQGMRRPRHGGKRIGSWIGGASAASLRRRSGFWTLRRRDIRPDHSWRRAAIGFDRIARTAGIRHARSVTHTSTTGTAMNVSGSIGVTAYSRLVITRESPTAAIRPTATPTAASA